MKIILSILLTISALLVGCSDDGSGENPFSSPPSKEEPVVEALAINLEEDEAGVEEPIVESEGVHEEPASEENAQGQESSDSPEVVVAPLVPVIPEADEADQFNNDSDSEIVVVGQGESSQKEELSDFRNEEETQIVSSEESLSDQKSDSNDEEVLFGSKQESEVDAQENKSTDTTSNNGEDDVQTSANEVDTELLANNIEEALATLQGKELDQSPEVVPSNSITELNDKNLSDREVREEAVDLAKVVFRDFAWVQLSDTFADPSPFNYELDESLGLEEELDIEGDYSLEREILWGLLPTCIDNMNPESLVSVLRGNWLTRIFADPNYKPIELNYPLVEVRKQIWYIPEEIPENLADWHWELDSEEGRPVSDVYSVVMSEFYDLNTRTFNDPLIVVTKPDSSVSDYDESVVKYLEDLKLCAQE